MTRHAIITIAFTGFWVGGTGGSGASGADVIAYRDRRGYPALPMTQVRGKLRETAKRVWGKPAAERWFGTPGGAGQGHSSIRFAGDATLGDLADGLQNALFSTRYATALNQGIVIDKSLREIEVVLPCTIAGRVEWVDAEPDDDWIEQLDQLCALTMAFGKLTNDGLGRAIASAKPLEVADAHSDVAPAGTAFTLELTPEHPAVFSRSGGTAGTHESIAAPTGAALWGWAIGNAPQDSPLRNALLDRQIAFSDAVPIVGCEHKPVYQRPAVLFSAKHQTNDTIWLGRDAFYKDNKDKQAEVIGKRLMSVDAAVGFAHPHRHRLRTAMEDGRAADGQLFGYDALDPGATYRLDVCAPDEAVAGELAKLFGGRIAIGKARNSGYGGGYSVKIAEKPAFPGKVEIADKERLVRIWCLSDIAVRDEWGKITQTPSGETFGLTGWMLDRGESAVTTRRYAAWDRSIAGRTTEIVAIEAGSVLAYFRPDGVGGKEPITLRQTPVGEHRHRGLGRWTVLGLSEQIAKPTLAPTPSQPTSATAVPIDLALLARLKAIADERDTAARDRWIRSARTGVGQSVHRFTKGPSRSQWALVRRANQSAEDIKAMKAILIAAGWAEHPVYHWLESNLDAAEPLKRHHRVFAVDQLIKEALKHAPRGGGR